MLALLPPPPPAQVRVCGPQAPALKGASTPRTTFSAASAVRLAMREMGSAVVVVEDEAAVPLAPRLERLDLFGGRLRVNPGELPANGGWAMVPAWMDPNTVGSNANAATRSYTLVGVGF